MADALERRGLLVYNPKAGGAARRIDVEGVVARAASRGLALVAVPTERPRHATELVAGRLGKDLDLVAVAGGDGTLGEAAEALLGTAVPIAILPAGTANVVAREYGVADADAAEEALFSGKTRPLTVFHAAGRACLKAMHCQGAEFVAADCLMKAVVAEITQGAPDGGRLQ